MLHRHLIFSFVYWYNRQVLLLLLMFIGGSPYLQHRVATLLVQHGRRHQNHPTRNPFLKSCRFRLCLVQAAVVVNLFCFEFGVLHFRLPRYTRNGQVGEHVFLLWFLALVLAGCCCQLVCFEFVVLHFRLPIPETRNGQIIEHVRTEKKQKRPCPAVQGTWLHVGPFLAGVLTQRFSTQPLELYIPRLSRCTTQ